MYIAHSIQSITLSTPTTFLHVSAKYDTDVGCFYYLDMNITFLYSGYVIGGVGGIVL